MRVSRWQLGVVAGLVAVSIVLYAIHFAVFRDSHHIWLWSLTSLAFLPVSALVVTLIINRLLTLRDRRAKLQKLNMVIGAFFSEVGNPLLSLLSSWDENLPALRRLLVITAEWTSADFLHASKRLPQHTYNIALERVDLDAAKRLLGERRVFLLRLLENPNLLEHEAFTALLRAVLHAGEELEYRPQLVDLPASDRKHLAGDFRRAYALLVQQWLQYVAFIKTAYPYLFSLAIRINPFDCDASAIVA